jgi:hypothetical protein
MAYAAVLGGVAGSFWGLAFDNVTASSSEC